MDVAKLSGTLVDDAFELEILFAYSHEPPPVDHSTQEYDTCYVEQICIPTFVEGLGYLKLHDLREYYSPIDVLCPYLHTV